MGIDEAVLGLKSSDAVARLRAASTLREALEKGEDISAAEGALIEALSDRDGDLRASSARLLSSFYGKRKRWGGINRILEHKRGDVRSSALGQLGCIAGDFDLRKDIPNIVRSLDDSDYEVRAEAAGLFEKAAAYGQDISFAIPGLKKVAIYGDERVKKAVANAIKAGEMRKEGGRRCQKCLDCETGFGPGNAAKCFDDLAIMIKSISCCGGDVTHRVFRCIACGNHYLSTYFDHSDTGHGQLSIRLIGQADAERIVAMFKKCQQSEWRLCKCEIHMGYLKDENVPITGQLKYKVEDGD
jgi:hypothetical protein